MATKMFDRRTIGVREKPLSRDPNTEFSQRDRALRDVLLMLYAARTSAGSSARRVASGFVGDGLRVVPAAPAAMSVTVNAGYGLINAPSDLPAGLGSPDLEGVDDLSPYKPLVLDGSISFAVPVAPAGPNVRTDLIEVRTNRQLTDMESRLQLDPATKTYGPKNFAKTVSFLLDASTGVVSAGQNSVAAISYKVGAVTAAGGNGVGTAPSVTPGYTAIAAINVLSTTLAITGNEIIDRRSLLFPGGIASASVRFRMQYNAGAPIVTIEQLLAPPNIDIAIDPKFHTGAAIKGKTLIHVFGGNMLTMCSRASASDFLLSGVPIICQVEDFAGSVTTYSDVAQAQAGTMTPVPAFGRNQQTGIVQLQNFALLNAGPSLTDVSLEDLLIDAKFEIGW